MPSVQRRGGGKNGGKAKNLKSQNSKNSTSSKDHWKVQAQVTPRIFLINLTMIKLFVFGLLAALASIVYYRQTSILTSLKVRKAGNGVDIQDGPIFNVVDIPGKGKGVLAARDIKVRFLQYRTCYDLTKTMNSKESSFFVRSLFLRSLYTVSSSSREPCTRQIAENFLPTSSIVTSCLNSGEATKFIASEEGSIFQSIIRSFSRGFGPHRTCRPTCSGNL